MAKYISKEMDKLAAVFAAGTEFSGKLKFSDSLRIDGKFNGIIDATGFLYIDEKAEVVADIKTGVLVVAGTVNGNITAIERLELLSSARVIGDIQTPRLIVADGVILQGKCRMLKDDSKVDVFKDNKDKVKKEQGV